MSTKELFQAVNNEDFEEVKRLIENGANINAVDKHGNPLLGEAYLNIKMTKYGIVNFGIDFCLAGCELP